MFKFLQNGWGANSSDHERESYPGLFAMTFEFRPPHRDLCDVLVEQVKITQLSVSLELEFSKVLGTVSRSVVHSAWEFYATLRSISRVPECCIVYV